MILKNLSPVQVDYIKEIKTLALDLMSEHGLIKLGWTFAFDNAKRRAGVCSYSRKLIGLSIPLVLAREYKMSRNTILHEIAHALTPNDGHGARWKRKAIEIGCDGERCFSDAKIEGKYKAVCKNGHVYFRHKAPNFGTRSSCGKCARGYNPEFSLEFKLNIK